MTRKFTGEESSAERTPHHKAHFFTNSGIHEKVTDSGLITEPAARAEYAGVLQEIKTFAESECGEHQ